MDKTSLYQQIDDQATTIEDLKEMIRIKDLTIKHQLEQLRELGVMSAHHFNGRLNKDLKYEETIIGLN
jgi:hypothetical protein